MLCQETNLPQLGLLLDLDFEWPFCIPKGMPSPLFGSVKAPEIENEFKLGALIQQYHGYVLYSCLAVISQTGLIPINFEIPIFAGIAIDVIRFFTDCDYVNDFKLNLKFNLDWLWDLMPDWSKFFGGGLGFTCPDFKLEALWEYIMSLLNIGLFQSLFDAILALIDVIMDMFPDFGGPGFNFTFDLQSLIQGLIDQIMAIITDTTKSIKEMIDALLSISLFGFDFWSIFGMFGDGEFNFPEFDLRRIISTLYNFVINFVKNALLAAIEEIMGFLELIPALGDLLQWLNLTFCAFLELVGFAVIREVLIED